LIIEERGYRYDTIVRQFASCLYILGGHTAYEFVRLNIPGLLPSVQIIQAYIAASENHLTEGLFNFDVMQDDFNSFQSPLDFCVEDATARLFPKLHMIQHQAHSLVFHFLSIVMDYPSPTPIQSIHLLVLNNGVMRYRRQNL
jgi:hypothetical protein